MIKGPHVGKTARLRAASRNRLLVDVEGGPQAVGVSPGWVQLTPDEAAAFTPQLAALGNWELTPRLTLTSYSR
jgi:hypothetical protein